MHPLIENLSNLKDLELESKINELSKKYFMTNNSNIKEQIVSILESYKEELNRRRQEEWQKATENTSKGLDKLININ